MRPPPIRLVPLALALVTPWLAQAQGLVDPTSPDTTLMEAELQEVVIQAGGQQAAAGVATVQRVEPVAVERADADAAAGLARLVPAAHVTTNSRGETLIYLRNGGERQTAFFLDGAPLNVPWDNRVDLGLLPASVIAGATVAKGPSAIEYGANVIGGVVNFTSHTPAARQMEVDARYGTEDHFAGSGLYGATAGRFSFVAEGGYARHDGFPVSNDATLPFSQPGDDLRLNTDARIANAYARAVYALDGARVGLTLLHVDAEKGVAPESHLDPAEESPRYWRYPEWRTSMAILSGEGGLGEGTWKAAAWGGLFGQHIAAYGSDAYESPEERQEDDDRTLGARLILRHPVGPGALRLTTSALTSVHEQQDLVLDETGQPLPGEEFPVMRYSQRLLSGGAVYELRPVPTLQIEAGAGFDASFMPETGDKPERDPFTDYNLTLGARYDAPAWFARAAAGRKTRFPTMRELFGEALHRFLVNPDLEPESSWLVEVGVGRLGERFSVEAIPFATFTSNTIDQRNVEVDGENRRQRINLKGSRVLGVELVGEARPVDAVAVSGHLTVMDVRRLQDAPDDPVHLAEKPAVLGRLGVAYDVGRGPTALVEAVYTGRAYSLGLDNTFVPLNTSLVLNLRAGYRLRPTAAFAAEVFARVDNVTDALVTPQLGLPGPGRTVQAGLKVTL
ncbi:MAG TPA: TonB-dependent receptor [Rubricoccaceae bacterium]|nr:TonB-dependent receptor [Rubricoccaceae bacterium]